MPENYGLIFTAYNNPFNQLDRPATWYCDFDPAYFDSNDNQVINCGETLYTDVSNNAPLSFFGPLPGYDPE